MSEPINVYEAKTQLSKLLDRAAAGEEVVIGRNGRPLARLVPMQRQSAPRVPGAWQGRVWMSDDFDETPPAMLDALNGPVDPETPETR